MNSLDDTLGRLNARIAYMESDKFPLFFYDGRQLDLLKCLRVEMVKLVGEKNEPKTRTAKKT